MSKQPDHESFLTQEVHAAERHHDRFIDYVKHLTTLSTGGILLQVAFLERLFPHPRWRALIVLSLIALAISVVASVAVYTMLLPDMDKIEDKDRDIVVYLMVAIWLGFLIGIVSVGVFGIRNIVAP